MKYQVKLCTFILFCFLCKFCCSRYSCSNSLTERNSIEVDFSRQNITDLVQLEWKINSIRDKFNVTKLDLSYNELVTLTSEILQLLPNIKILNVSHNNIKGLSKGVFLNNNCLQIIDLSYNSMQYVPSGLLGTDIELSSLKSFNVSHNQITDIGLHLFHGYLKRLRRVDISYNNLEYFEPWPYRLSGTSYITEEGYTFDLSHNNIHRFSNKMEFYVHSEQGFRVDMNFNNLTEISLDDYKIYFDPNLNFTAYNIMLLKFDFPHNPWICDCKMYPILKLSADSFIRTRESMNYIMCSQPLSLKGKLFRYLIQHPETLVCNLTENCPEGCFCQDHPSINNILIDCSQTHDIAQLPLTIPTLSNASSISNSLKGRKLKLNFYNNKIEYLTSTNYTSSIIYLNISRNRLTYIDPKFFLESSQQLILDITYNFMTSLPNTIQNIYYNNVYFQNNQLHCSCDFLWFNDWNRLYSKQNKYTCLVNNHVYYINEVTYHSLQCYRDIAILMCSIMSPMLLILVLIVFVYQKWKYPTLVMVHNLFRRNQDVQHIGNGGGVHYDFSTYISSNHENEEIRLWIRDVLLVKLEKFGLNIFYPPRDNPASDSILDVMIETMTSSRTILVILDRTYLHNGWCIEEFDHAHQIVCEDKSRKIILLLYDYEITQDDIQQEPLKTYVTQQRYILRTEILCWPKLKYELFNSERNIEKQPMFVYENINA